MRVNPIPSYLEALSNENSLRVVQALAKMGGITRYSQLEKASGVEGSVLVYHLHRLIDFKVIEMPVKGTYRLRYKTPLCYLYHSEGVEAAYLGLLGRRDSREEPETDIALRLLREEGVEPKLVYIVTSPEALDDWRSLRLPYQWILCYEDEIIDIDTIKRKVTPQLESLLRDYIVILDCTSATKPATIAYYELAQAYLIPLIYVYEETKQLKWLISKETIGRRIGLVNNKI